MARTVAIGIQDFGDLIQKNCFYVDKTLFIKEWWESNDSVTLINRPRRFGKTLNMSMLEQFFSIHYAGRSKLFEGLAIWEEETYRQLQGTYPVMSLSFARVKETTLENTKARIREIIRGVFKNYLFLRNSEILTQEEKAYFSRILADEAGEVEVTTALHQLSEFLYRYYGKRVLILLDEYDTPMQEAYVKGYWDGLADFTRSLFNSTFKTNPYLERAVMTGITRVSKDSIFSDLNHLEVVTTTSDKYATSFGFTEPEVFAALEECGLAEYKEDVKRWYDGFIFGRHKDIYNPWSILNFLDSGKIAAYWANTSANSLVGKLIREGNRKLKEQFERLLCGENLISPIDEQIVYNQLDGNETAVWSLLLASGYLKVLSAEDYLDIPEGEVPNYELALTNLEVKVMFYNMVRSWFRDSEADYNDFVKALLMGDKKAMNAYMNRVALSTFSYFDTGAKPSGEEPERFYHGFVLGLIVDLQRDYVITSNRESGFGRYDVMIEPKNPAEKDAIILEFKVHDEEDEESLKETVAAALKQIEEKQYAAGLEVKGIPRERIRSYGVAFQGKKVLIG
ncbi:MAG: AAA family ATPase [Lachnospiraceae bacterium]|nr:AAA family ATPase [Lachnospiraceae bacterium]